MNGGGYLVRYQYWRGTDDSYSLPPGDRRTLTVTTTTGLENTTTEQTVVSQSMAASASAGWGPISSNVSYALSESSNTTHTYTITEQTTRYESIELFNFTQDTVMYLAWQMMDVIDVYGLSNGVYVPGASIVSARAPKIYAGPFKPVAYEPTGRVPSPEEEALFLRLRSAAQGRHADRPAARLIGA
jgi:hypothetical protein